MIHFFEAVTMNQWAKRLGLFGEKATFAVQADTLDEARQILSRTLLRPLQHEGDRSMEIYEVVALGGASMREHNIAVYCGFGKWATPNLRALVAA